MDVLWSAILAALDTLAADDCCQVLVVLQQYIEDLCKSPAHLVRLVDTCIARMARV